jgi:2-oxoglutarate dehydrogenase E2 component (dihydrolipoamide succinyltransferase)
MPTPIVMPQMGESIAEGTIVRWIKKVGDQVDRDEPLFEITTDKVDAEVPSPVAGILTEITAKEGQTVSVNSVVGTIAQTGDEAQKAEVGAQADGQRSAPPATADHHPVGGRGARAASAPRVSQSPSAPDELRPRKSSPLVRRIARENNIDVMQIAGSGLGGRVTKDDILAYLGKDRGSGVGDQPHARPALPETPGPQSPEPTRSPSPAPHSRTEIQPLSVMRKKIAEHMVLSRRTSAHVHSVFHVNFSHVEKLRREKRADYERLGAKLTYMAFIAKAVMDALRKHPIVNASLDGDNVIYKKDVNLGIAVALEEGLIVPVIKNADEKNLLGLSRAIADVAERARSRQLKPAEVQGGTFTITNPGQFGAQFGLPIINQPQVAILGVGTIEKRTVVVDDAIAIRTMAYLTLGYDHRLIDGAVADQFMFEVKTRLEQFDSNHV